MKKMLLAAFALTLALPVFASDEETNQEYLQQCEEYAKDDGVSADEMEDYIQSCVKEMQESAAGSN
jgi:antitoxin component of RelBE/YafQ-DinJ toxin-antitoxin module